MIREFMVGVVALSVAMGTFADVPCIGTPSKLDHGQCTFDGETR